MHTLGFPGSSAGKESTCNAGDPGLIPGWERSAREGISYPLQYSWASLVAQLVKNPPAMWETQVEKGTAIHSSILAWRIPWTVCIVHGVAKSLTRLSNFHLGLDSGFRGLLALQSHVLGFSAPCFWKFVVSLAR